MEAVEERGKAVEEREEAVEEREEAVEEREEGGPLRLWAGAVVCMWSLWRALCSSHTRHYCSDWTLLSCSLRVPKHQTLSPQP